MLLQLYLLVPLYGTGLFEHMYQLFTDINCHERISKSVIPLIYLTYGLGEKEARRPTPKWNTRFYLAFSIRA